MRVRFATQPLSRPEQPKEQAEFAAVLVEWLALQEAKAERVVLIVS